MQPIILKANSNEEISKISQPFLEKKFKEISKGDSHIILKKRNFGSPIIHICFLLLILFGDISFFENLPFLNSFQSSPPKYNIFVTYIFCFFYVAYIIFNLFTKTKVILITTETRDEDGNPIKFNNIDEV
ncbi:MAG: hypothetical protein LBV42_01695 [Methanobrevibacter sp.]|jgi:hypothetical protein|nr:hypothetical protein [Methanobrevibacter sp.]